MHFLNRAAVSCYLVGLSCHQGLFEWLKSAELRSTEEFLVGTDLESVREQLCDLKVGLHQWNPLR